MNVRHTEACRQNEFCFIHHEKFKKQYEKNAHIIASHKESKSGAAFWATAAAKTHSCWVSSSPWPAPPLPATPPATVAPRPSTAGCPSQSKPEPKKAIERGGERENGRTGGSTRSVWNTSVSGTEEGDREGRRAREWAKWRIHTKRATLAKRVNININIVGKANIV